MSRLPVKSVSVRSDCKKRFHEFSDFKATKDDICRKRLLRFGFGCDESSAFLCWFKLSPEFTTVLLRYTPKVKCTEHSKHTVFCWKKNKTSDLHLSNTYHQPLLLLLSHRVGTLSGFEHHPAYQQRPLNVTHFHNQITQSVWISSF